MKLPHHWEMPSYRMGYHSCRQYQRMQVDARELNIEHGIHITERYTTAKWRECSVFEDKKVSRRRCRSWKDLSHSPHQYGAHKRASCWRIWVDLPWEE